MKENEVTYPCESRITGQKDRRRIEPSEVVFRICVDHIERWWFYFSQNDWPSIEWYKVPNRLRGVQIGDNLVLSKQSNMTEEAGLVGWGLMARACRLCLIMENDSAWAWVFLCFLSALEGGSFYNSHTRYLVPVGWMNKGETIWRYNEMRGFNPHYRYQLVYTEAIVTCIVKPG